MTESPNCQRCRLRRTQVFGPVRVYAGRGSKKRGRVERPSRESKLPGRRPRPGVALSPTRSGGSMPIGPDYDERTGENEALFREVNERLKERKRDDSAWQAPSEWICECAEETCTERIVMSPLEYEQLRSEPTHFAVVPNEEHVSLRRGTDCREARSLLGGREGRRSCRDRGGNRPPLTGSEAGTPFQDSRSGVSKSRESLRPKRGRVKSVSDLRESEPSLQLRLEAHAGIDGRSSPNSSVGG